MSTLSRRAIPFLIAVALVGVGIYYSQLPWFRPVFITVAGLFTALGLWEYYQLIILKGMKPNIIIGILVGVLFVVAIYPLGWLALLGPVILFWRILFRTPADAIVELSTALFGQIYVAIPMGCVVMLTYGVANGQYWLLYLIGVTKIGDTAAYFVGTTLGRVPLAPQISPKKTIEGALGGILASALLSLLLGPFLGLGLVEALGFGTVVALVALLGDLAESALKRDAGVKDSGQIPGLGGVLDMIDSLLFTAPLVYFYVIMRGAGA